ncbi:MAG: DUF4445 domain-containing protein [Oscillospiraceae bacterium]|nr:DUF4445 domain-containing protein [Oscillospiraceae bacterium]
MEKFSEKVYLSLKMPTEDNPVSDEKRIRMALDALGYQNISLPLLVLRKLHPLCRIADFDITVTLVHRDREWIVTDVEAGDTRQHHYGLAVDYGSTTIVIQLVDLNSGAVVGEEQVVNGQVAYGTDILTRITFSTEDAAHADDLQRVTVSSFEELLDRLTESTGIEVRKCPLMIVSGNTTMIHFLLKLDAWTVFASPYAPVTSDPGFFWGRELAMDFEGLVYIIPAASNYVGGDIVSGLLVTDLHKQKAPGMFFDIGTNGELVIGNREWIIAGAGAAGPALEGYISRFGMRAAEGAVDSVRIDGENLFYTTIGNKKPVGICGSGIIDLLAQMRLNGWINIAGELNPQASPRIRYLDGEYAAVYATAEESAFGEPLYFSQTDIMQYLDTKAAAYTMVECLLETAGVAGEDLAHCWLSGAFPAHSDLESAITIGIFPDLPREKYTVLRNTSLEGARRLLLDYDRLAEVRMLAENIYCVQFASIPDFLVRMQAAKFIPHTDMFRYPRILERLHGDAQIRG